MLQSLEIKRWPSRDLTQPCFPVPESLISTAGVQDLIDSMKYYLAGRQFTVGLSANQVGSPYKIAIVRLIEGGLQEIINPEYEHLSDETFWSLEGCASAPPLLLVPVTRRMEVSIRALDREGKEMILSARGLSSAIIQHEVDHLNGILILNPRKRARFMASLRESQGNRLENPAVV